MPSYGGQWTDPNTGKYDEAGYQKYLRDINKKYLENLAAQGKLKADNKWAKEFGVDVNAARAKAGKPAGPDILDLNRNLPTDILPALVGMGDLRALEARQALTQPGVSAVRAQDLKPATLSATAGVRPGRPTGGVRTLRPTGAVRTRQVPTGANQTIDRITSIGAIAGRGPGLLEVPRAQGGPTGVRRGEIRTLGEAWDKFYTAQRIHDARAIEAGKIRNELWLKANPEKLGPFDMPKPVPTVGEILQDPKYAERLSAAQDAVRREATKPVFGPGYDPAKSPQADYSGMTIGYTDEKGNPVLPTLAEKRYVDEVLLDGRPGEGDLGQKPKGKGVITQALETGDRSRMPPIIFGQTAYTLFNSAQQMKLAETYGLQWGSVEAMMESLEYEFDPLLRPLGGWIKRVPARPAVQYPFQDARRYGGGGYGGGGYGGGGRQEGQLWNWNVRIT